MPTSVDLFINGYRSGSTQLQPGPFTLTNLPYINGAGDAVLVTTDALGRGEYHAAVLRHQRSAERRAERRGRYPGACGATTALRILTTARRRERIVSLRPDGLADAGGHAEGAEELALAGAGTVVKLGRLGVVNTSYSQSRMRGDDGGQINWGYQYSTSEFSLATQHTRRDRGFGWPCMTSRRCTTKMTAPSPALAAIPINIP